MKPCPWCDSFAIKVKYKYRAKKNDERMYVECQNCRARGPLLEGITGNGECNRRATIASWDDRVCNGEIK